MHSQVYKGYFENGQSFYTDGKIIDIPARFKITVILDEQPAYGVVQPDKDRISKRLAILQSLKGILPPDIDLASARAERISKRGLME